MKIQKIQNIELNDLEGNLFDAQSKKGTAVVLVKMESYIYLKRILEIGI
nr:hypothetical protein [Clostridium sporogenes]